MILSFTDHYYIFIIFRTENMRQIKKAVEYTFTVCRLYGKEETMLDLWG